MIRYALILVLLIPVTLRADLSETDRIVDSLFIRASSAEIANQHLVDPSREALGEMGLEAVPRLITKLNTDDARERHALDNIFGRIGSPAVPALVEALNTDEINTLKNGARCLGEIGDKSATPALLPLFDHAEYTLRSIAVTSVGKCHDFSAVNECVEMLSDTIETVRKSAAVALGRIAHPDAVPALVTALEDWNFSVRMTAARSLSEIGDPACRELMDEYSKLSGRARALAFEVWANAGYTKATRLLEDAVEDPDPYLRAFSIYALASIDPKKCRKSIDRIIDHESNLFVRSRIEDAQSIVDSVLSK
jgi:HEAT repeat protein